MVVLSSFSMPESPIRHEQRNTRAVLDRKDLGLGTVYISERTLCWKDRDDQGFCLTYPHISLHAISSDSTVYQRECIYIMIDTHVHIPGDDNLHKSNDDGSDSETDANYSELILVPGDPSALNPMYEALRDCQTLNPDPEDSDDEYIYEDADDQLQEHLYPENESDFGAGGDTEMENITRNLHNSVQVSYDYANGDHSINEDEFEDAD